MLYVSRFCIKSSKNKSKTKSKDHVKSKSTQKTLKNTTHIKNRDIKNHCLKLDKTWDKNTSHL